MLDITQIIVAVIGLIAAVISAVLIPWIRSKLGDERWQYLCSVAQIAVQAAEQYANAGFIEREHRINYAMQRVKDQLAVRRITFDEEIIRAAIEAAVYETK